MATWDAGVTDRVPTCCATTPAFCHVTPCQYPLVPWHLEDPVLGWKLRVSMLRPSHTPLISLSAPGVCLTCFWQSPSPCAVECLSHPLFCSPDLSLSASPTSVSLPTLPAWHPWPQGVGRRGLGSPPPTVPAGVHRARHQGLSLQPRGCTPLITFACRCRQAPHVHRAAWSLRGLHTHRRLRGHQAATCLLPSLHLLALPPPQTQQDTCPPALPGDGMHLSRLPGKTLL